MLQSLDPIFKLVQTNTTSAIIAPPGSGKSTTIVQHLHSKGLKIFVVEPTVLACDSLYRFVGSKYDKGLVGIAAEGNVQYQNKLISVIRNNKQSDLKDSEIVYCTGGHMKKVFLDFIAYGIKKSQERSPTLDLKFCDVLMIDEAHSGSIESDMIMFLYKYLLSHNAILPKLLMASATLTIRDTPFPEAESYTVKTDSYKINIIYHDKNFDLYSRSLYEETAKRVLKMNNESPLSADQTDVWLVFCAGASDVELVSERLSPDRRLEVVPIYGNLSSDDISKIYNPLKAGIRRIVVSTNIAEVAITIDMLSGIFDTLTEKYSETSATGGHKLSLNYISKSSAEQRKGRTGRTCDGFCYRMMTEDNFNRLNDSRAREITRIPLHNVIIELLNAQINLFDSDGSNIFFGSALSSEKIKSPIRALVDLDMFDNSPPPKVTEKGNFVTHFNFSIYASSILYEWTKLTDSAGKGYPLFPAIVFVSLYETFEPSYFYYPPRDPVEVQEAYNLRIKKHYQTYFSKYDDENDMVVLGKLWNDLLITFDKNLQPKKSDLSKHCTANSLNNKKIAELYRNINNACSYLASANYKIVIGQFNMANVIVIMLPLLKKVYGTRVVELRSGDKYTDSKNNLYTLSAKNPIKSGQTKSKKIIPLTTIEIKANTYISLSISVDEKKDLAAAKPLIAPLPTFALPASVSSGPKLEAPTPLPQFKLGSKVEASSAPLNPFFSSVSSGSKLEVPTPLPQFNLVPKVEAPTPLPQFNLAPKVEAVSMPKFSIGKKTEPTVVKAFQFKKTNLFAPAEATKNP